MWLTLDGLVFRYVTSVVTHVGVDPCGQIEQDLPVTSQQAHIVNCGRIIEDME